MEREVLEGMILGVHGEPALSRFERSPLRDGERHEHAAHLQAHVPVEPRGVMAVNEPQRCAAVALGSLPFGWECA